MSPRIVRAALAVCWVLGNFLPAVLAATPPTGSVFPHDSPMATPAAQLFARSDVLVIGHRGYSGKAPENTLPAFQLALDARADLVELDYYHSADGQPWVFHDKHLDRTTDAVRRWARQKVLFTECDSAALRELDAGSWFDCRFAGTRIPTLAESLRLIQSGSTTLIERKGGDAATCVRLLRELGCLDQVVVQAFDWDFLRQCRAESGELTLVMLGEKQLDHESAFQQAKDVRAAGLGWKHSDLTPEAINAAHQQGLKVWAWTVNDSARALQLVAAGVDGLITDYPGEMASLVRRSTAGAAEE